jgi:hypothetical protein
LSTTWPLGIGLALQDDAQPGAARFVADIAQPLDGLVANEVGDFLEQRRFVDQEGDLGNHDILSAVLELLDIGTGAQVDHAAAGGIGLLHPAHAVDHAAGKGSRLL